MQDNFEKIKELRKNKDIENDEFSKNIKVSINKELTTVSIGIIVLIEEFFGHLWGHGKNTQLTKTEEAWKQEWLILRDDILDHTNLRARKLKKFLENVEIKQRLFTIKMRMKND